MDRRLQMRMDNRTREEFEQDIAQFTFKELYWGIAFRLYLRSRGLPCDILEHGVDNSGRLIEGRLPNHNVDKKYVFTNGMEPMHIEIKTIPEDCLSFFTFKVSAIKGCFSQKAKILVPTREFHILMGKKCFFWLLDNCEQRKDYRGWGGKLCVRVSAWQMRRLASDGIVTENKWTPPAREFIESVGETLFEKRLSGAGAR